jgi:hypothetical protein
MREHGLDVDEKRTCWGSDVHWASLALNEASRTHQQSWNPGRKMRMKVGGMTAQQQRVDRNACALQTITSEKNACGKEMGQDIPASVKIN